MRDVGKTRSSRRLVARRQMSRPSGSKGEKMILKVPMAALAAALLLVPLAEARDDGSDLCPEEPKGRPSKATIRQIEQRLACLQSQLLAKEAMLASSFLQPTAAKSDATASRQEQEEARKEILRLKEEATRQELFDEFGNGNWSLALAGSRSSSRRIAAAEIDAHGIVRVTENRTRDIMPVAVYTPKLWTGKDQDDKPRLAFGVGPMAVANLGILGLDDDMPQLLGAGIMVSARSDERGSSVGIGIAYTFERAKLLRDEFVPGQPAPLGADGAHLAPLYADRTTEAWMLVVGFSLGNAKAAK